ncbi:MAG: 3-dehydroquinate synthase [Ruminococcaceae bacterium]|nr:3-dehydroquinate synthase [Oscillospiraceae bacterium]
MKTLQVMLAERSYDILIQTGILKVCGEYIKKVCKPEKILVVTDTTVESLYKETILAALSKENWEVKVVSFSPGEGSKTLDSVSVLYREAFSFGMTRTDLVVALGGGVIGDLTGFFAATLFRGVSFVQIPTTLLAQVDSSVGGKTGVNVPEGKNLVGSFYQPKLVLIDPDTLKTLPDRDFYDGMAEVIKYGCICKKDLFEQLSLCRGRDELTDDLTEILYHCCDAKRKLVEEDELDTGSRMLLNFGHTMGHVIEKTFGFEGYTHGQGVAIGMMLAAKFGEMNGMTVGGTTERIEKILKQYQLPTKVDLPDQWEDTLLLDKKMQHGRINFIMLKNIGTAVVQSMETNELILAMKKIMK